MRQSTALFLLALVLLFALFGWKALGVLVGAALSFVVLLVLLLLVAGWTLRRRLEHKMRAFRLAVDAAQARARGTEQREGRPGTIDVDAKVKGDDQSDKQH